MTGNSPDGDKRSPALEISDSDFLSAGAGKYRRWIGSHRNVVATALAVSALVPLTQPAAGSAEESPGAIARVTYTNFTKEVAPAPEIMPAANRPADPKAEVRKLDLAEKTRRDRVAATKERLEAAKARLEAARRAAARPDFVKPAQGRFTSGFGARWGTSHNGIDIANSIGTPIVSVADGTVVEAGPASGFGLWVQVRHRDGTITVYGHMNEITVSTGQTVQAGQQIATIGNRGQSTGPHLHFEVWQGGSTKIDPVAWLAERGISVG